MARNKDYKGDGLIFAKAVADKGFTIADVMAKLNISRGTLYNYYEKENLPNNIKEDIAEGFGYSVADLFGANSNEDASVGLSGKKEVIPVGKHAVSRLKPDEYGEAYKDWQGLPMYNMPITASFIELYREDHVLKPQYYLHDPRFKDCDFGAIITGDSMYSEIRHGDYVACKEILDLSFIVFGEIYYIVARNGLETCKYLNADPNNGDNYMLIPRNDKISPSPINKEMVSRLFKVRGIIRGY